MTPKQCTGKTKKGTRCKNQPMKGHLVCQMHIEDREMDAIAHEGPGEELMEAIARALLLGSTIEVAAAAEGVSMDAIRYWIEFNLEDFARLVERCYAQVERDCMAAIAGAAKGGDWRAAVWILERKPNSPGQAPGASHARPPSGGAAATATGPSSGNPDVADDQVSEDGRTL